MDFELKNNKEAKQYEMWIEGHLAKVEYILSNGRIFLTHTEVPKSLGGRGVGTSVVKLIMEDIEKQNLVLVPLCPFVALFLKKNPEWMKLVMNTVTIK